MSQDSVPVTLEVSIRKSFALPEHKFLLDVHFTAEAGVTVIFGPSGAGKTTLLDCIAGLQCPDAGRIGLGGGDANLMFDAQLRTNLPPRNRGVGFLFQTPALFPHMTAQQNAEFGLHALAAHERGRKASEMLEAFRIAHLAGQRPGAVSGGERQRVALARTLVTRPRVLLLDEPLSALDSSTKRSIMDDLQAWNRENPVPILYVTHSLEESFTMGDRVLVLEEGKITRSGSPAVALANEREELLLRLQPRA